MKVWTANTVIWRDQVSSSVYPCWSPAVRDPGVIIASIAGVGIAWDTASQVAVSAKCKLVCSAGTYLKMIFGGRIYISRPIMIYLHESLENSEVVSIPPPRSYPDWKSWMQIVGQGWMVRGWVEALTTHIQYECPLFTVIWMSLKLKLTCMKNKF